MEFREITAADLSAIPEFLSEGFPTTRPEFWHNALDVLTKRRATEGMPRYGIVMEKDGDLAGVLLMMSQRRAGVTYCNLSSWYVRDAHRGYAPFMFGHSLTARDAIFLDCSPTPSVVALVEKFGFEPYTGGSLLLDPRVGLRRGPRVSRLTPAALADWPHADRARVEENLRFGCRGFMAHDDAGRPTPILYREARLKRHIPVARFVYGAPEILVAHAGSIMRHLTARSIPLALMDWPAQTQLPFGRALPRYGVRYKRGATAPALGDLLDTEYALFGI